ncbi:hypothetical protein SLE2022_387300 [Rubroshorea leprosula]
METTLSLSLGPLPCFPLHPSPMNTFRARPTNLHFSFNHSSLSLSTFRGKRRRSGDHVFTGPIPHALDCRSSMGSKNEQSTDNHKAITGALGASVVLACAIFACGCTMKYDAAIAIGPRIVYQKAPAVTEAVPTFQKMALNSLLEVTVALASSQLEPEVGAFNLLPLNPSKQDVDVMKMDAVKMMKNGKADEAVDCLQRAYMKYKNNPEPAYNVEMALVEILISQGKYKEALERKCLRDELGPFSDFRQSLYKAILFTMLDKNQEAKTCWQAFGESHGEMNPSSGFNYPS